MGLAQVLLAAGGIGGWVAIVVSAIYVGRSRAKDELIELQDRQEKALRKMMADNEHRCAATVEELRQQISHLQGKVDILSEQQGAAIGAAIAPIVADTVVRAIREGEW